MKITSIRIKNYKSFLDSDRIELSPKTNILIGQNNSGKTALIEAISLNFSSKPHKSIETIPNRGDPLTSNSRVEIQIEIQNQELINYIKNILPTFNIRKSSRLEDEEFINKITDLFKQDQILVTGEYLPGGIQKAYFPMVEHFLSDMSIQFELGLENNLPTVKSNNVANVHADDSLPGILIELFRKQIFFFKAERFNIGESSIGISPNLNPMAENLPEVLHLLYSSNPHKFNRLLEHIKIVFPEIKQITVPPIGNSRAQILLWSIDPSEERVDLATPLQESGTGIGQVIAILYVAISSDNPQSILIDEPQSFLHPGAIRKLFSILGRYYSHHQYIVTTHSPVVISAINPTSIILLQKAGAKSVPNIINTENIEEMARIFSEIGARLSDVFGADNILWVEGATEESCFPLIVGELLKIPLLGTIVLGVLHTGDFDRDDPEKIFRIYKKLSSGRNLLPPAIGFIFDRDGRTDEKIEDLVRESKGKVIFTDRRLFENYLLNPHAIASVLNANIHLYIEDSENVDVSHLDVTKWIDENGCNDKYLEKSLDIKETIDSNWVIHVHGAKILIDLFNQFTGHKIRYEKVVHGIEITKWLIVNSPQDLDEIVHYLKTIMT